MPQRSPKEVREQLKDKNIANIVQTLEGTDEENGQYWSRKGYLMNNGLLYRYSPESNNEDSTSCSTT